MTHEEIQDLLEDFVDDKLDRATRKEVHQHLETCAECRAILDTVAPVDMSALGEGGFDERAMRRTARRSVLRTAFNALVLVLAGFILVWLFSAFVYQPLVINRGGRAGDAAQATIDVTSMITPGAVVTGGSINSGLFDRTMTFDVILPVGSTSTSIGPVEVILGTASLTGPDGVNPWPYLGPQEFQEAGDQMRHLGDNTVATLQVELAEPITVDEAQAIADEPGQDVRVVWAGFDLRDSEGEPLAIASGGTLGYGTCIAPYAFSEDTLAATSAGFTIESGFPTASIQTALGSVIAALENLEDHPEWLVHLTFQQTDRAVLADAIDTLETNPTVRTMVVTGPSDQVARFLDDRGDEVMTSQILAVDFYNWAPGLCGR
jgi:hypothetical protein